MSRVHIKGAVLQPLEIRKTIFKHVRLTYSSRINNSQKSDRLNYRIEHLMNKIEHNDVCAPSSANLQLKIYSAHIPDSNE